MKIIIDQREVESGVWMIKREEGKGGGEVKGKDLTVESGENFNGVYRLMKGDKLGILRSTF